MATMKPRITFEYFVGDLLVPNLSGDGDHIGARQDDVNHFLTVYEIEYLKQLLGYNFLLDGDDLFTEFNDALVAADNDFDNLSDEWKALYLQIYPVAQNTFLISPAAYYVYYKYMRDSVTITLESSQQKPQTENAVGADSTNKLSFAWNRMVELSNEITLWIVDNITTYDSYSPSTPYFLKPINRFGI